MANFINVKCTLRVLASGASGVPNAKFLAFGTLNTKNPLTEDVLNVKCQMSNAFGICYGAILHLEPYMDRYAKFFYYIL